jgi:hypothetical protein
VLQESAKQNGKKLTIGHPKGDLRIIYPVLQVVRFNPVTMAHPPAVKADKLVFVAVLFMDITAKRTLL